MHISRHFSSEIYYKTSILQYDDAQSTARPLVEASNSQEPLHLGTSRLVPRNTISTTPDSSTGPWILLFKDPDPDPSLGLILDTDSELSEAKVILMDQILIRDSIFRLRF
jgi:hypothetical protein